MYSGQEAFGCSTEWPAAATQMTSGQQQQHILVLRLSVSKEQMVTSSQSVCLTQPPLKGHGCCFGGCPSLLSDLTVVISSATNP